jgi:ATP-binding protein involved in chromosome partitioning
LRIAGPTGHIVRKRRNFKLLRRASMAELTEDSILQALRSVRDGDSDIVARNMVSGIAVRAGHVRFALEVDPARGAALEPLRQMAERTVGALPGVLSVTAVLTAERAVQAKPAPKAQPHAHAHPPAGDARKAVPGVKHVIAVASGKGGVGKSTTAVNLALAFAATGLKVGLLDADIYGPSVPRMMGINRRPDSKDGKTLIPPTNFGIACMSIGFMIGEDTPMIWRGPMVMSALQQMLYDVDWGQRDVLVVDLPPGTGDAQLTMAQRVPLAGAVIVSTPQDIALIDARKGLNMFRKVSVPVLGIVENMSFFLCPHCGERSDIFGHGGARDEASKLGVPFLGEVPLHLDIRTTSDEGKPIVATRPDAPQSKTYRQIAERVWAELDGAQRPKPRIVVQ